MVDTHPVVVTAAALAEAAIVAVEGMAAEAQLEGTVAVPEDIAVEAVFESFDKL